jgi:hypothetical protein
MPLRTKAVEVLGASYTIRQLGIGEMTDVVVAERKSGSDAVAMFALAQDTIIKAGGLDLEAARMLPYQDARQL